MRRMWRLMRKKRATRPLLSHHPMFLSPLSYSMVPMQPVHLCCHLPCHVTYLDWNGHNEEKRPSTFTCVVSSALRGCHENLIIEPIYPDIYATIKAFMWLSRRNAALCVLVPSHSDFTSTNRRFAATAGENFEACLGNAYPMASWVWRCMMEKPIGWCLGSCLSVSQAYPWSDPCPWDAPSVI